MGRLSKNHKKNIRNGRKNTGDDELLNEGFNVSPQPTQPSRYTIVEGIVALERLRVTNNKQDDVRRRQTGESSWQILQSVAVL